MCIVTKHTFKSCGCGGSSDVIARERCRFCGQVRCRGRVGESIYAPDEVLPEVTDSKQAAGGE
jgi:hypothetical protein